MSVVDLVEPYPRVFAPDLPALLSCRIDITLRDGRVLSRTQGGARGHPDHPDSRDSDIRTKFLDNCEGVISPARAREVAEQVDTLDQLGDLTALMGLLSAPPDPLGDSDGAPASP
ncbi:hypothetical protein [Streptacidiphilus sp. PAMC 29251]